MLHCFTYHIHLKKTQTVNRKNHEWAYKCNEKWKPRAIEQDTANTTTMFSKLQPQHHPFSLSTDEDNRTVTSPSASPWKPNFDSTIVEVVRHPRGRPPGSKNKPKPPATIHQYLVPYLPLLCPRRRWVIPPPSLLPSPSLSPRSAANWTTSIPTLFTLQTLHYDLF